MSAETKFEQDLKVYFPEIYEMHELSKDDKFFWYMVEAITRMIKEGRYGDVTVNFQQGKITRVMRNIDELHGRGKNNLNRPR